MVCLSDHLSRLIYSHFPPRQHEAALPFQRCGGPSEDGRKRQDADRFLHRSALPCAPRSTMLRKSASNAASFINFVATAGRLSYRRGVTA
jgi:hypothetical protein